MRACTVNAYGYVFFDGWSSCCNGIEAHPEVIDEIKTSAIGWAKDRENRLVYFKDEGILAAQKILTAKFDDQSERIESFKELAQIEKPLRLEFISREIEATRNDLFYPGFSLLSTHVSMSEVPDYHVFWGIHKSGLIFIGNKENLGFSLSENLFEQFHLLVVEKDGMPIRIFNGQNPNVIQILRLIKDHSANRENVSTQLDQIESDFLKEFPDFSSKYDLLEKTAFGKDSKKRIKETTESGYLPVNSYVLNILLDKSHSKDRK